MIGLITSAVTAAWAFVAPWAGPALAFILPAVAQVKARMGSLSTPFGAVSGLLVLLCALGVGGWLMSRLMARPPGPATVLVTEVELNRQRAAMDAMTAANERLQRAHRERAAENTRLAAALAQTEKHLEAIRAKARAQSGTSARPVFTDDDPWLRTKRGGAKARQTCSAGRC